MPGYDHSVPTGRLTNTGERPPEVAYSRYDELLADPDFEAVIIGIADQFHVSAAAQAIAAGKEELFQSIAGYGIHSVQFNLSCSATLS